MLSGCLDVQGGPALYFDVFSCYNMLLTFGPCRASGRLFTTEAQIQKQAKYGIYGAQGVSGEVSVQVILCPSVSIVASVPFPIRISLIYHPRYVISGTDSHGSLYIFFQLKVYST
jgi:hypothetical protein